MGIFLSIAAAVASMPLYPPSVSVYPVRLNDRHAVFLEAKGDGVTDDTAAIQSAIDRAKEQRGAAIVFVPSGRYRITDTLRIWPGIRTIGYGPTRPILFLAPNTPGYDKAEKYMVFFAGFRPRNGEKLDLDHPGGEEPTLDFPGDATPGTFYSAMSNINIEIGDGNPAAVGVRGRYAQHCFLSHMDFHLGSAMAGIHDTGNVAQDLRFFGGKWGIITRTPSPGWQYTLLDSVFEGQSVAAIRTYETGLTLIRPVFRKVPTAVAIEPNHTEQLWMSDARMEDISGPAILISREKALRTQINIVKAACRNVPTFAAFRESGIQVPGKGPIYEVEDFAHGSCYASNGNVKRSSDRSIHSEHDLGADTGCAGFQAASGCFEVTTQYRARVVSEFGPAVPSDVRPLPDPHGWVNLVSLGARGDGEFDNTAVLRSAIERYPAIYIPSGRYRVTGTITLKPNTALIGLHPFTTQILIKDGCPAFRGTSEDAETGIPFAGNPVPLIEAPQGGHNIVTGIGLDTGGNNPAAEGAKWMAGSDSMINDVKFLGGHGSVSWEKIYNANHTADPDPSRRWDSQYPSLCVINGGAGTFLNIWTASTFAAAGMQVSDTAGDGRVYGLSSEHHVRYEIRLRRASNWSFYSLQTEEERGEGPFALPLDIDSCSNILLANFTLYRVISMEQPFPYAVRVAASKDVRFRNVHCNSNSKASFDSLVFDSTNGVEVRQRDLASLDISRLFAASMSDSSHPKVRKLAGGFFNISGGAVDAKGDFYFVDAHFQRIYKWDAEHGGVSTVQDSALYPVNLVFDKAGNLIVVSYAGKSTVYAFKPGDDGLIILKPAPSSSQQGRDYALPVSDFEFSSDLKAGKTVTFPYMFASPDGTTLLPVGQDFLDGATNWGIKSQAVLRSFGLAKVKPGQTFYMTGENIYQTYAATVEPNGALSHGRLFAEQGGEGVAVDTCGNVYIAAGQIYVYNPSGNPIGEIDVPDRPIQLVFGGRDGKTLFIAARTSLYAFDVD